MTMIQTMNKTISKERLLVFLSQFLDEVDVDKLLEFVSVKSKDQTNE